MLTMEDIVEEEVLERAYAWMCQRRLEFPAAADCWAFRHRWPQEQARLRDELLAGDYQISLLTRVTRQDGTVIDLWAARDAVVLKALALVLGPRLPASPQCYHLPGRGGSKGAVRFVLRHRDEHTFVLKTDVKAYYASIDHLRLLDQLAVLIADTRMLTLLAQHLRRCAEQGGLYWPATTGIALGCPLSPLLGALFLYDLCVELDQRGFCFALYMDDLVVLTPTRWSLRRAVRLVNQGLAALGLEKHPTKTFIGRIAKGFDFLSYHVGPDGFTLARTTGERFMARAYRLYEREPGGEDATARLGAYVRRWWQWVRAGIPGCRGRTVKAGGTACPTGGCLLDGLELAMPRAWRAASFQHLYADPVASVKMPVLPRCFRSHLIST